MKSIITFILLFACTLGFSQVTNQGSPASWDFRNDGALPPIVMPAFDMQKIQQEDAVNDLKKDQPWRFGYEFTVDYNLENSGKWQTLENGDRVWRIRFYSEGSKTMNFIFSDFYMPDGATLYLYNNDRTDLLGAYDSRVNNPERQLGTWLVNGQDIWLEYYEPKEKKDQGRLEIYKLVHGYRGIGDEEARSTNINESASCHYDVDCNMGANVDALKNINKKGVAKIVMNGSLCSGTLINNVNNDGTPYFLTANHCFQGGGNPVTWSFQFNWISPNPVCAATTNSTNGTQSHTMNGATLKANRAQTDFCLLRLNQTPNPAWNLVWVGWTRSTSPGLPAFGIHHPAGDIMKVSKDNQAPVQTSPVINGVTTSMWEVDWDMGVTEGGSSGSALFNSQGKLIGQLYGGTSECSGTLPGGGPDIYGRFNVSWNGGNVSSQRLRDWLDPENTDAMDVNYYTNGTVGIDEVATVVNDVKIYPNPSNGIFNVSLGDASEMNYEVYNILGQTVKSGKLSTDSNTVNLTDSKEGVYILKLTDTANNTSVTRKIVKE